MSRFGVSLYALGALGFLSLGLVSPAPVQLLAVVYFGGLSASFLYTGGVGLKVQVVVNSRRGVVVVVVVVVVVTFPYYFT